MQFIHSSLTHLRILHTEHVSNECSQLNFIFQCFDALNSNIKQIITDSRNMSNRKISIKNHYRTTMSWYVCFGCILKFDVPAVILSSQVILLVTNTVFKIIIFQPTRVH